MIGLMIFGEDLNWDVKKMREVLDIFMQFLNKGMSGILPPLWIPVPINRKMRWAKKYMWETIHQIYQIRMSKQSNSPDLLNLLIKAKSEVNEQPLSFQQIQDEILTLIIGGHETTASGLSWIIYLIATHPEWEEILLKEWTFEGLMPTYEDLQNYTYTKMVVQEAMRLYPPVWLIGRTCKDGDVIDGYEIKKNTSIILSIYHIHRHPDFWDNPDQFDPERFHPSKHSSRDEFAFIPFAQGGHMCLGRELAMLEMMTAIPAIFKKYKVKIPSHAKIEKECIISTRPKYGIEVILESRSKEIECEMTLPH
jgi:cytochrome P450